MSERATAAQVREWTEMYDCRYMVHGARDLRRVCLIARDGIIPGDQIARRGLDRAWDGQSTSRDGVVYIGTAGHVHECCSGARPFVRVDLHSLDAARLACDEDHVSIYTIAHRMDEITLELAQIIPESFAIHDAHRDNAWSELTGRLSWRRSGPLGRPLRSCDLAHTSHGAWANRPRNAAALARAEFVHASIMSRSVAYEGAIAPRLLAPHTEQWQYLPRHKLDAHASDDALSLAAALALLPMSEDLRSRLVEYIVQMGASRSFLGPSARRLPRAVQNQVRLVAADRDLALAQCERIEALLCTAQDQQAA